MVGKTLTKIDEANPMGWPRFLYNKKPLFKNEKRWCKGV